MSRERSVLAVGVGEGAEAALLAVRKRREGASPRVVLVTPRDRPGTAAKDAHVEAAERIVVGHASANDRTRLSGEPALRDWIAREEPALREGEGRAPARLALLARRDEVRSRLLSAVKDAGTTPSTVLLLVDLGDPFGSAVLFDVAHLLREAGAAPIALLRVPGLDDPARAERASAALADLERLTRGKGALPGYATEGLPFAATLVLAGPSFADRAREIAAALEAGASFPAGAGYATAGAAALAYPGARLADEAARAHGRRVLEALLAEPSAAPAPLGLDGDVVALHVRDVPDAAMDLELPGHLETVPLPHVPTQAEAHFLKVEGRAKARIAEALEAAGRSALREFERQVDEERRRRLASVPGGLAAARAYLGAVKAWAEALGARLAEEKAPLAEARRRSEQAAREAFAEAKGAPDSFALARKRKTFAAVERYLERRRGEVRAEAAVLTHERAIDVVRSVLALVERRSVDHARTAAALRAGLQDLSSTPPARPESGFERELVRADEMDRLLSAHAPSVAASAAKLVDDLSRHGELAGSGRWIASALTEAARPSFDAVAAAGLDSALPEIAGGPGARAALDDLLARATPPGVHAPEAPARRLLLIADASRSPLAAAAGDAEALSTGSAARASLLVVQTGLALSALADAPALARALEAAIKRGGGSGLLLVA